MNYGLENEAGTALEKYPYTFKMWKADHPNMSVRKDMSILSDYRVVPVTPRGDKPEPSDNMLFRVAMGPEVKVDNVWSETWTEVALTADEIAAREIDNADRDARINIKTDAFVQTFIAMTPAEVIQHVNANVTNLASAKTLLKQLSVMVLLLARQEYRD